MTVRELLKQILYYEVAEIRDFEGKNLIARTFTIEDLDRFYDCEVKDFNYDYSLYDDFYVLKIFI